MPRGSVTAQNYSLARHPSAFTQHRATAAPRRATTKGSFLRRGSQDAAKALSELTVPSRAGRSGYLLKQGVGNRAWKSRWFVLPGRDQLLLYYEDSRNSIVPKRIVRVVGPVAARPEAVELNGHAGYAFDVWAVLPKEGSTAAGASQQQSAMNSMLRRVASSGTAGRIQYRLAAPTEAEAQEWLDALRRCLEPDGDSMKGPAAAANGAAAQAGPPDAPPVERCPEQGAAERTPPAERGPTARPGHAAKDER